LELPVEIEHNSSNIQFNLVDDETVEVITIVNETSSQPSSIHVSPSDIIPIPKISQNRNRRKKGKRSEILSGTPYKNTLVENEIEKVQKQNNIEEKRARKRLFVDNTNVLPSKRSKPPKNIPSKKNASNASVSTTVAEISTAISSVSTTSEVLDVSVCPACEEKYEDPPHETWIRCDICLKWWHEDCAYLSESERFVCDFCK